MSILVGIGKLSVIWVPGPLNLDYLLITPASVQLFGAGITKVRIHDPWVLSVSFPLGAVLFFWRQRADRMDGDSMLAAQPDETADETRPGPIGGC